ncbi:alpha/beta fold hydrolase [Alienimonas californiensis]|uniref:Lipase 3 n=1 Tax=Alienimonas californiensis TaxID=2527989 RepID=A0A517PDZ2_9PLAN|nr:alpha/beta fold hydrolase [Alienimonas californiensis]QDT17589.1 Lipase 3 precursor [Alienimonas californiensis]
MPLIELPNRPTPLFVRDAGHGPPVLLIHGWPHDRRVWDGLADALSDGHRVIVPDLPGFGYSPPRFEGELAETPPLTMEELADDLAALLDALGVTEPVTVGGVSMGGYAALAFAERFPDRLAALLLFDTKATADSDAARQKRSGIVDRVVAEGTDFLIEDCPGQQLSAHSLNERPEVVERLRAMVETATPAGIVGAQRGMAARAERTDLCGRIEAPTLVLGGAEDTFTSPGELRALADSFPRGQYAEFPACGHLPPLEDPEAAAEAVLRFLDDPTATSDPPPAP